MLPTVPLWGVRPVPRPRVGNFLRLFDGFMMVSVGHRKHHITSTYGAYDMIPLQISAHLLSRLAAVQDVLKTNSGGTKLLHALQSAGAELSSIGPALFDQFVSLIPQDKRWDVVYVTQYDYVMGEIHRLIAVLQSQRHDKFMTRS